VTNLRRMSGISRGRMVALGATAVAGAVAVWLLAIAADVRSAPGIDHDAFSLRGHLRSSGAFAAVKELTWLGASPVVGGLVLAGALWLLRAGRRAQALGLAVGMGAAVVAAKLLKDGIDRARPPASLVHTMAASFPSGHATYSVALVAIALTVPVRRRRGALVAVGVILAVAVGISRVYLRAHFLTDVLAGWALGTACFAAGALVVAPLRHNGERG
jgi:membrane-associated phospholipid phosphatase